MSKLPVIFLVILSVAEVSAGQTSSMYKALYEHVSGLVNPLLIPRMRLPIMVQMQGGLIDIHGVDRERNSLDVSLWGRWSWKTDLRWSLKDFDGIMNISIPAEAIWTPDVHLYNGAGQPSVLHHAMATLRHNGLHSIFFVVRSHIYCDELLEDSCSMKFASLGQNKLIMALNIPNKSSAKEFDAALAENYFRGSKYEITSQSTQKKPFKVSKDIPDKVDMVIFSFSFKEKNPSKYAGPKRAVFQWY